VTLQLFLVAVLPLILLVLLVTFGSLRLHHDAMRSLVADRNLRAVQSAAASLSNEISHRGKTLELLSRDLKASDLAQEMLQRVAADLTIFEGGAAVVAPDGSLAGSTGTPSVRQFAASDEWPDILALIQEIAPGSAVYLPVREVDGRAYVPVLVSTTDGTALLGLFSPENLLARGLTVVSYEEPLTIVVVNQDLRVLYERGRLALVEDIRLHPGIQEALEGQGDIRYLHTAGEEHVVATSIIEPVNWVLMIEESWQDIASPLLRATQNAPLIIIPIFLLSLLALLFGLRQIVQPMQALTEKASALAGGDFESIQQPVGGVPEVRHLQTTLADMALQLKEAQNSLHSYVGAITESVENERRNLARELHDETLQSLIALGQYTHYALHWNKDARVEKTLNQIVELAENSMHNLRQLVRGLRPIYIEDLGLATALEMHAANQDRIDSLQVHFLRKGEERRLKPDVEMALYRMAQEALSNVQRHSNARNAWVSLYFHSKGITLEIRDDGIGFEVPQDPVQFARKGHYGLLSLYERAELIGAKFTIHSAPGEGSLIRVRLTDTEAN
jgi:signal transduction histidine kinase